MSRRVETDRFELLAAVGRVADGSLTLAETVERLLDLLVPDFADLALLDAVRPGGELHRLGARVDSDERAELERALLRRRINPDASVGVSAAVASGQSNLLAPVREEHLRALAASDEDLELLRRLRLRTSLFVPLSARGQVIGSLACGVGSSSREYTEDDLRFAEVLSGRVALALDNAGLSETVSGLEQRLEATLANLAEAVLVRDGSARIVFANPAAARLLGFESPAEVTRAAPNELMALFSVFDEAGQPVALEDLPSTAAGRGEFPPPLLVRNVVRETGAERWLLHKATPAFDRDGEVSLVISVIEDVTSVKRGELAQRLLAEAGKALSSSLDYEQTLQRVAQMAVPELADWCGVSIRGAGDLLDSVAVAHADPEKVALARAFAQRYPARMSDATGTAEVIRTGQPQLVPEITPDVLEQAELADEQLALLEELQMRSVIIVPLEVAGHAPIGAMTLVMAESGRVFNEDDLALAEELGRRAATAVENARLYTERSRIATTLQRSLLPPQLPDVPGFRLASLYRPAGDQNEVGGDFYDAFEVPDGWMLVVGDVAGRGAEAAALTSLSRYTLRAAARLLRDPVAAVAELNAALLERPQLSLVSVCCALLRSVDGGAEADVVLAGHPPAYHLRHGAPTPVGEFAPFLGAFADSAWKVATVALAPGDQLVLYTDGVIDTVGESERFGEVRLSETLAGAAGAADAVGRIQAAMSRFAHGPQVDDTAILVVERVAEALEPVLATAGSRGGSRL